MEKKSTIFSYIAQIMIVFGFAMLMLNIFCIIFGENAKDFSALFEFGNVGIPVNIVFQFLCVSALIVFFRFIFFTDVVIKKMDIWLRTIGLLMTVIITIVGFIIAFHWFPVNMWQPWVMFFLCLVLSFLGSLFVMILKEKIENKRMEEALRKIKKDEERIV